MIRGSDVKRDKDLRSPKGFLVVAAIMVAVTLVFLFLGIPRGFGSD